MFYTWNKLYKLKTWPTFLHQRKRAREREREREREKEREEALLGENVSVEYK